MSNISLISVLKKIFEQSTPNTPKTATINHNIMSNDKVKTTEEPKKVSKEAETSQTPKTAPKVNRNINYDGF